MSARPLALAAALALSAAPLPARATGVTDVEALLEEPVLTTVSRSPETRTAAPATSTIISAEDLWRFGIRSLDEAVNYLSLGMFTQDPLHGVEIGARGVLLSGDYGNHVLLLVDGHAMNEPWDGTAYFERGAAIPFELIDHVELIVGPGSVLYGGNAMLGVINVITKRAKDYRGTHLLFEGQYPLAFRVGLGAGYDGFKILGRAAELTAQIEYYAQQGPSFTFGPQSYGTDAVTGLPKRFSASGPGGVWGGTPSTTYQSQVPAGHLRMIVGDVEVMVRAAMYRRGNPYVDLTNTYPLAYNEPSSYELDRWFSFDVKHKASLSSIVTLNSRAYGDSYDYQQRAVTYAAEDCLAGQLDGCSRHLVGVSRWVGVEERVSFDWTRDGRFETQVGVDGRLRFVGSKVDVAERQSGVVAGSLNAYTSYERAVAVYAQQILRPLPWLAVNGGVRFDLDERFGHRFSPRAALVLQPARGTALKVIYAEAFRAPTSYEVFFADPSYQVASQALRPEVTRSVEAHVEQKVGTLRALFGGFRSYFSDVVQTTALSDHEIAGAVAAGQLSAGTTSAIQYRNTASIDAYGFEGAVDGTALQGQLRYGVNATGAYARRTAAPGAAPEPLGVAPSFYGNARLSYDPQHGLPNVAVVGLFASQRLADRALAGGFSGGWYAPPQISLRLTASGPAPKIAGLSYRLFGEYSFGSKNPYAVGPLQSATAAQPAPELVPVVQYRVGLGLRYDLPF